MTPEGKVKDDHKKLIKSKGERAWYYMPIPMGYGPRGIPDFVICYRGFFLAPETKKAGGKSEPWQNDQQKYIRDAGGQSYRAQDTSLLKYWMDYVDAVFIKYPGLEEDMHALQQRT